MYMRYRIAVLLLCILFYGCATCAALSNCKAGPIEITHKEGNMPDIKFDTGVEDLKLKAKKDEIRLEIKKKF